ncbi:hypothetical protein O3V59_13175 [Brevibacillus thermoruber]|uniref:Uncharacterized protein n=1 Tax=Brevibacillus thermoruber TaxID=33942 RepID=A0A9X3TRU7_9BACL|nr:hypothetical protein [Brevibacillus thermoruber]MDA5109318.1 hypothetical protein [Brevibacillus thermoruber]
MKKTWVSLAAVAVLLSGSLVACSNGSGTPEPATQQDGGSATTPGTSTPTENQRQLGFSRSIERECRCS